MKTFLRIITLMMIMTAATASSSSTTTQWRRLDDGLELARFRSPAHMQPYLDNDTARTHINVLRINPALYELLLFNASNTADSTPRTARQWAQRENLAAVINAAMYQMDMLTSVSHMRTSRHVNNPRMSRDKTILLFEPRRQNVPPFRIVDTECDNFETLARDYGAAVQSIRMISCGGENVWRPNDRRWSITAVGADSSGMLLFVQSTAIHSVHEFIDILRVLPINITRAMYMEGGSPSQMFINLPDVQMEFFGDFTAGGRPTAAPAIPNVLGVRKRF